MNKKFAILTILFLILPVISVYVVSAQTEEVSPYRAKSLEIDVDIKSKLLVTAQNANYVLEFLNTDLYFKPIKSAMTTIINLEPVSPAEDTGESLRFRWEDVKTGLYDYGIDTIIRNENVIVEVKNKIPFPTEISGMDEFLIATEQIDSDDPAIIAKANELAAGEDDYYEVVSKLGIWVKNVIDYDLSTMTADASQKSSWVLENRIGVCDELTSLFTAMLRAIGIPAKFISGLAYTEDPLFPDNWGAHGWAEVYFPGVGWVPYDPTYGEFGWVDPTHIKLREAKDATQPSVRYEWQGRDVEVSSEALDIKAKFLNIAEAADPLIEILVKPLHVEVGFESFNLIEADIKNLNDFYLTIELIIAKVAEIDLLDGTHKQVILRPGETRKVFWKMKVKPGLEEQYIYTIPLHIESVRKETGKSEFKIMKDAPVHADTSVETAQETLEEERTKEQSKEVALECIPTRIEYYAREGNTVVCSATNLGNIEQKNLEVCLLSDCKTIDLGISQEKTVEFELKLSQAGEQTILITAKNEEVSKTAGVSVTLLDEAGLTIEKIEIPATVEYNDKFPVKIMIKKTSSSDISNVHVIVKVNKKSSVATIKELRGDQPIDLEFTGSNLKAGKNSIKVIVEFTDQTGKTLRAEKEFEIELVNLTLLQKIINFLTNII